MPGDLSSERKVWDAWLAEHRGGPEEADPHALLRSAAVIEEVGRLRLSPTNTRILEVGCGAGHDSVKLARLGRVTATDLAPATVARAATIHASSGVEFVAGDFLNLDFHPASFDVIVTLETIAHVHDQQGFVRRCAELLREGGLLVVTTQNRPVYEFLGFGPALGYVRRWLSRSELAGLLEPAFRIERLRTVASAEPGDIRSAADGRAPPATLRVAYSHCLNRAAARVVPARWLDLAREYAGLGRTVVAVARRT